MKTVHVIISSTEEGQKNKQHNGQQTDQIKHLSIGMVAVRWHCPGSRRPAKTACMKRPSQNVITVHRETPPAHHHHQTGHDTKVAVLPEKHVEDVFRVEIVGIEVVAMRRSDVLRVLLCAKSVVVLSFDWITETGEGT